MGGQEFARDGATIVFDEQAESGTRVVSVWADDGGALTVCEHATGADVRLAFGSDEFEHRVLLEAGEREAFERALGGFPDEVGPALMTRLEGFFSAGAMLADLMDLLDTSGVAYGYLSLGGGDAHFRPSEKGGDQG